MGDTNGELLREVQEAFAEMEKYYNEEGEIKSDLLAKLLEKMNEFEGIEAELQLMEEAIEKLNKTDDVSSASASGTIFAGVKRAFGTFLRNQNIRTFGQRLGEEVYSNFAEHMLDRTRQSSATQQSSLSQPATEFSGQGTQKKFDDKQS